MLKFGTPFTDPFRIGKIGFIKKVSEHFPVLLDPLFRDLLLPIITICYKIKNSPTPHVIGLKNTPQIRLLTAERFCNRSGLFGRQVEVNPGSKCDSFMGMVAGGAVSVGDSIFDGNVPVFEFDRSIHHF